MSLAYENGVAVVVIVVGLLIALFMECECSKINQEKNPPLRFCFCTFFFAYRRDP